MNNDEKIEQLFKETMIHFDELNGTIYQLGENLKHLVSHGEVSCTMSCEQFKKSRFDEALHKLQWFLLGIFTAVLICKFKEIFL